jgi:hypothetical protein
MIFFYINTFIGGIPQEEHYVYYVYYFINNINAICQEYFDINTNSVYITFRGCER